MAGIKKTKTRSVREDIEKGKFSCTIGRNVIGAATTENTEIL